jgi:hypothetical protein
MKFEEPPMEGTAILAALRTNSAPRAKPTPKADLNRPTTPTRAKVVSNFMEGLE